MSVTYVTPTFGLTVTPTGGTTATAGQPVTATLTAGGANAGNVTGWTVDWGDNQTTAVAGPGTAEGAGVYTWAVPPHTYGSAGSYVVSATPTDQAGQHTGAAGTTLAVAEPAVTGLTATATDDNDVTLTWTPGAGSDSQFEVDRQNPDGTWAAIGTVDDTTDGDTYTDSGLTGGTAYDYRVREVGPTAGLDSPFATAQATTPLTTPDVPTDLAATESRPGEVDLTWSEDSAIVTGYVVTATPLGGGPAVTFATPDATQAYAATGLTPDAGYTFTVAADNDQGNGNDARSAPSGSVTAVAPAAALTATAPATVAEGQPVTLTVASSAAGTAPPIASWQVAWADTSTVDTVTGPGGSDAHTPAAAAAEAAATVVATDAAGDAFTLPAVSVAVVPAAPGGLTATVASATEVDLSWADHSAVAADDEVYESTDGGQTFAPADDVAAVAAGSTDTDALTGLTPGTAYLFRVAAEGGAAESAPTATVAAPTPFVPPTLDAEASAPAVEGQTYPLGLTAEYPDGEAGAVTEWRVTGDGNDLTYPASADPTRPVTAYPVLGGDADGRLVVTAVDPANGSFTLDGTTSPALAVTPAPSAPDQLRAAAGPAAADGTQSADLTWRTTSAFPAGTVVLESDDGGRTFGQLAEVDPSDDGSYAAAGLLAATAYSFEVATDSGNGWSALTAPVTLTTPADPAPQLTVTPVAPPAEGQPFTLDLTATDPAGLPTAAQVDQWTVNWNDPSAPGTEVDAGAVVTAAHTYPDGTAETAVTVSAVNGAGQSTVVWSDRVALVAPTAATGLAVAFAQSDTAADVTWAGRTGLAGTTYLVQRQDPVAAGGGAPAGWATVGTVAATADGQSHAYAYTDTGLTPAAPGAGAAYLYRVTAAGPTPGSGDPAAGQPAATVATPSVLPGGVNYTAPDSTAGVVITYNGVADPDDATQYAYDQPVTIVVSNLPAHMAFGIDVNAVPTFATAGDSMTLTGPGGRTSTAGWGAVYENEDYDFGMHIEIDDDNAESTYTFTLTPHLHAADENGNPNVYMAGAGVSIANSTPAAFPSALVQGGTYDIPVTDTIHSDPDAAPIVLQVVGYDAGVIDPLEQSVTLDRNGNGYLPVRVLKGGVDGSAATPLVVRDGAGDVGSYYGTYEPGVPYVKPSPANLLLNVGSVTVGGGAAAVPASFDFFVAAPSSTPITVDCSPAGTDADPALVGGLPSTVTIPAGVTEYDEAIPIDYGYQKVSPTQQVEVTLTGNGPAAAADGASAYQQATLLIQDNNSPVITVDGDVTGADVTVDPQGDDSLLGHGGPEGPVLPGSGQHAARVGPEARHDGSCSQSGAGSRPAEHGS